MSTRSEPDLQPEDARRVKHTRIGIWDIYEARKPWHSRLQIRIPSLSILETYAQMLQDMPYVVRMLKDMYSIPRCFILISAYLVVELLGALIPAFSLWYVAYLLATPVRS